jgi:hypothetical protein
MAIPDVIMIAVSSSITAGFARQRCMGRDKLRSMKAVGLRKLRSAVALTLVLWCAGAGCMIVSYAHNTARSGANAARSIGAGLGQASGSMDAHGCCRARHASERRVPSLMAGQTLSSDPFANLTLTELTQLPISDVLSCCPLTSGSIVVTDRQRTSNDHDSVASGVNSVSSFEKVVSTTPSANSLRLPNQSHTYLQGCVFLI